MARSSDILGMNARQRLFKVLNPGRSKRISNSKLLTKKVLGEADVSIPKLYKIISENDQIKDFDFDSIESSFVIKPSGGSAGKGILIIKKPSKKFKGKWLTVDGKYLDERDLQLHISDILEGQYSTFGTQHKAFIEERVPMHSKFKKYVYKGTPDIRVVVFNKVPVMAMLRLPTEESEGRANLHQGAIGVGIDIATGITLKGVQKHKVIQYLPGTKTKLNGIKIPQWNKVLKTSIDAATAANLVYGGIDILLHEEKGPMVVELNASPGLDIQLANDAGQRRRLERIQGLNIRNTDHAVRVAKALFAESFADKVKADEGLTVVETFESVEVRDAKKIYQKTEAMIDTGLYRSQIQREFAKKLGLLDENNILWEKKIGKSTQVVVEARIKLKEKVIKSAISVVSKTRKKEKILIGRLDLQGFMVNPELKS